MCYDGINCVEKITKEANVKGTCVNRGLSHIGGQPQLDTGSERVWKEI